MCKRVPKKRTPECAALLVGPELEWSAPGGVRVAFGVDLPIDTEVTGTQIVNDYRARASVGFRF